MLAVVTYGEHMYAVARAYWVELLTQQRGNVLAACRVAKCNRTSAYTLLQNLGINPNDYRATPIKNNQTPDISSSLTAKKYTPLLKKHLHRS